jgi:hypothetical protein
MPAAPSHLPHRIGIVGAGRSRQGLGPYLAKAFTIAGCRVHAVAGRDLAGAERAASALGRQLGHTVLACDGPMQLARQVDALVIAGPVPCHLEALRAGLAAGVPCLCEKPLVGVEDTAAARAVVDGFRDRGLLLVENCQWPFVLPAFHALYPERTSTPVRSLAMGLGPGFAGPAMVADSLSHALSMAMAVAPMPHDARPSAVRQTDGGPSATVNLVTFTLPATTGPIAVTLHLQHCAEPPRPAWFAVDGCRLDRRLGVDYAQSFVRPDGVGMLVQDPLHQLVYGFVALLQAPNRERIHAEAAAVALRLELYAAVLSALGGGALG